MRISLTLILGMAGLGLVADRSATAAEHYVGGPVKRDGMEIVANYLTGIEMAPMPADMAHGPNAIHLEADVHALADNPWGFAEGAWMPGLRIDYHLAKQRDPSFQRDGTLLMMTAKDGPHYAANVEMPGSGRYTLSYTLVGTSLLRHVDAETGVPDWWRPFTETFAFDYPQK